MKFFLGNRLLLKHQGVTMHLSQLYYKPHPGPVLPNQSALCFQVFPLSLSVTPHTSPSAQHIHASPGETQNQGQSHSEMATPMTDLALLGSCRR